MIRCSLRENRERMGKRTKRMGDSTDLSGGPLPGGHWMAFFGAFGPTNSFLESKNHGCTADIPSGDLT